LAIQELDNEVFNINSPKNNPLESPILHSDGSPRKNIHELVLDFDHRLKLKMFFTAWIDQVQQEIERKRKGIKRKYLLE